MGIRKWLLNKNTNFGSKYVITMTKYFYVTSDGYIFVTAFSCGCRNHLMMRMKKALEMWSLSMVWKHRKLWPPWLDQNWTQNYTLVLRTNSTSSIKKFRVALHISIPDHHGWTKYYYSVTCKHHMISKDYNRSITAWSVQIKFPFAIHILIPERSLIRI